MNTTNLFYHQLCTNQHLFGRLTFVATHYAPADSDWFRCNLQAASLEYADLSFSNLQDISVADASLFQCCCTSATFGKELHYNGKTNIDENNHDLISMVLLSCAKTVEQKQFALYIRYEQSLCWSAFTRLLLRQPREIATWVKTSLGAVDSLRPTVEEFEDRFQHWLSQEKRLVYLVDINPSLHDLVDEEIRKNPSLRNEELYWFLHGVLASACTQPHMAITEEQYADALDRLRGLTKQ